MPRFKDYPDIGAVAYDDFMGVDDTSTDKTRSVAPGRIPAVDAVADLPGGVLGDTMIVRDGRKAGESASNGTGVHVWFDGTGWIDTFSQVAPID